MVRSGPEIRPIVATDRSWIAEESLVVGGPLMGTTTGTIDLRAHPGAIAVQGDQRAGAIIWSDGGEERRFLALWSKFEGLGTGRALLEHGMEAARLAGCQIFRIATTNDNLRALKLYQRAGFRIERIHVGGFANVLETKGMTSAPLPVGQNGIVIRDIVHLVRDAEVG